MRSRYLLTLLPVLLACPLHAQQTYLWQGGSGDWHVASNWSPAGIPGPVDTARVHSGEVSTADSASVARLVLDGGNLSGGAPLTVLDSLVWRDDSRVLGSGRLWVQQGATMWLEGSGEKRIRNRHVIVAGTLEWFDDSNINGGGGGGGSVLEIAEGGLFDIRSDGQMFVSSGAGSGSVLNHGTIRKSESSGTTDIGGSQGFRLFNDGLVEVLTGTLRMGSSGSSHTNTHTGDFHVAEGAILRFSRNARITLEGESTISGSGEVRFDGAPVHFAGTTTVEPAIQFSSGEIEGLGELVVASELHWTGGQILSNGTLRVAPAAAMHLLGEAQNYIRNRHVIVEGTLHWSTDATINGGGGGGGSVIEIAEGGLFDIQSNAQMSVAGGTGSGSLVNHGTVQKSQSEGTTDVGGHQGFTLVNHGLVEVLTGELRVGSTTRSTTNTGEYRAAEGAVIRFQRDGTTTLEEGASLTGEGTFRLSGGTLVLEPAAQIHRFLHSAGTLAGTGVLTVLDELVWSGGAHDEAGTTRAEGTLVISGSAEKQIERGRIFVNAGPDGLWTGDGDIGMFGSAARFRNEGTLAISSDARIMRRTGAGGSNHGRVVNAEGATLIKQTGDDDGVTTITGHVQMDNEGLIEVHAGAALQMLGGGTSSGPFRVEEDAEVRYGGSHTLEAGGVVEGVGTVDHVSGTLTNHATFSPGLSPGLLTFDGDFAMASGDAGVAIELGGTVPGDEYDRLVVTGSAALQGTLSLTQIDGFVPAPTDTFTVLTAGSVSGTFDEVDAPTGAEVQVIYDADAVRVVFAEAEAACDGIPVTTVDDMGPGSLREAIVTANARGGANTICFAIQGEGPHTIAPQSSLPAISASVVIDGYSQPGSSPNTLPVGSDAELMIELDGTSGGNGLRLNGTGSVVRGLVINRFGGAGIRLSGGGGHLVEGNFIGTDVTGMSALGNGVGIDVHSADNTIGGTTPAARNVIAGNGQDGINHWFGAASGSVIQGNYIGVDAAGTAAIPNGRDGVRFDGAGEALVGGPSAVPGTPPGNVISGNERFGVFIVNEGSEDGVVQGNIVCADATGTAAIPNGDNGIYVVRSDRSVIGGTAPGTGNLVSGCTSNAIGVERSDESLVQGNLVGPDITGMTVLGNTSRGVNITRSDDVLVGGTDPAARNVISGNQRGVRFNDRARYNLVHGNFIGVAADGMTPMPNEFEGVLIRHDSRENVIGGTEAGEGNVIAHSGTAGVAVIDEAVGNSVLGNTIYASGTIGIDLGGDGPTPNDPGDGDSGPNQLRNFPEILVADIDAGGDLFVEYVVDTDPENATYPIRVEFFVADEAETAGEVFLGFDVYTESDHGVEIGTRLVATATDADGNTSEFSAAAFGVPIADGPELPDVFELEAVYPNPLRASATVAFALPEAAEVSLTLFDLLGRRVAVLLDGEYAAGRHNAAIDANGLASGVYVVRLAAGQEVAVRRVTVVR